MNHTGPLVIELSAHQNLDLDENGCWAVLLASSDDVSFLLNALAEYDPANMNRDDRWRNRRIMSHLTRARMKFRNMKLPDLPEGRYLVEHPTRIARSDLVLFHAKGAWVPPEAEAMNFGWATDCYLAVARREDF